MAASSATDLTRAVAIPAGDLPLGGDLTVGGVADLARDWFLRHLRGEGGAGG